MRNKTHNYLNLKQYLKHLDLYKFLYALQLADYEYFVIT